MIMRQQIRRPRWPLDACLLLCIANSAASFENKTGQNENNSPRVFSPRMDYDEWTPLGRGDPLKNDPTFDYVPPILDRVQYWMDSQTTESAAKSDILVLGVTAKKTSPKIPEQFLKFVNGPKFMRNPEVQASYATDFTGSRGAEPPKLIRKTTFRNGVKDYRNQDRLEAIPASYYPSSYYGKKSKPDTMMMPPPVLRNPETARPQHQYDGLTKNRLYPSEKHRFGTQTEAGPVLHFKHQQYDHPQSSYSLPESHQPKPPRKHQIPVTSDLQKPPPPTTKETLSHIETIKSFTPLSDARHESTTATVSSEKSNLIYQSSQTISGGWLAKTRPPTLPSLVNHDAVTWRTGASDNRDHRYDEDVHQAAGSSHHEVVLGPNANIIVEGDSDDKEEIVIGQKEAIPPSEPTSIAVEEDEPEDQRHEAVSAPETNSENMYIVLANSSPSMQDNERTKESAVTVVMPESFEKNATDDDVEEEIQAQTTISPSQPAETEKSELETATFGNAPARPHGFVNEPPAHPQNPGSSFMNDLPQHQQAMRIPAGSYQQAPTRQHAPHREFGDASSLHHQPSHARPGQVVTHHGPNVGAIMGMNFRETPPPPPGPPRGPLHSGIPMGHVRPNMMRPQMPPFKTMSMPPPPPQMMNVMHYNQPHRFYHNQAAQTPPPPPPPPPTNGIFQSMTSMPINSIRDLLLKDEAHRDSQRMPAAAAAAAAHMETTATAPPLRAPSSAEFEGFSSVNANKEDMRFKDDSRRKVAATTEATTTAATTPTTTTMKTTTTTTTTTTEIPRTTTTAVTLTTDPIFSHYKQPANPLRGPMYLIIQGHSKVKTYKPWVDKHGNQVERSERLESTTTKPISDFEKFVKENTRKIAEAGRIEDSKTTTEKPREQSVGQDSLLSLVDSGLGAFPVSSMRHDDGSSNSLPSTNKDN